MKSHLIGSGFAIGLESLTNFEFAPNRPYVACLLCGRVFQSAMDRKVPPGDTPANSLLARRAKERRDNWAKEHASKDHTLDEHAALAQSGRTMTPEAANILQAYGLIPISDMVLDPEIAATLQHAKAIPIQDAEG